MFNYVIVYMIKYFCKNISIKFLQKKSQNN